jgi:hypothetical protein
MAEVSTSQPAHSADVQGKAPASEPCGPLGEHGATPAKPAGRADKQSWAQRKRGEYAAGAEGTQTVHAGERERSEEG